MNRLFLPVPLAAMLGVLAAASSGQAAEIGHFNGGVMNIRDYLVPEPGFYGALYNYVYTTDRINDPQGHSVNSVTIRPGPGPGVNLGVNVDLDMYALAPTFIWITEIEALGIKYGALITPSFIEGSLHAALSTATGRGGNVGGTTFGVGDLYVQPLWLGKTTDHWDFAFAYGFYAPIGRYSTETVTLPVVGPVKVEDADNLGYGFWTHQFQGTTAWYPMDNKGTAIVTTLTYETNSEKDGFDLTPGDNLSFNWGISQMVPLKKDQSLLLEIGPAGYDTWQVSADSGSDASSSARDQVHAAGGQLALIYVPWSLAATFHGFGEYKSEDRFQGGAFGLSIVKKI